ncbi:MAG: hypothetical protein L0287_16990 [Anaerolineae bacterium]|nr:hypothetical protein [Anaerolineae bacterium]MCI0607679.1 hypothetical protein [Anaerolineae bacterium]
MSLIDRYIAEVGRHLPEKNREDIEAEIRSMLEDMIDENSHQTGKPVNDELIAAALEQLGDPKLLAHKYAPARRYLIGPDWYEAYIETLKRVLATALPVVAILTIFIALAQDPIDFVDALGQAFGRVVDVAIGILFWVTAGFVIVEHSDAKPNELERAKTGAWTVAQLPEMPKKRQISVAEALTNIVFITGFTVWVVLPFVQSQGNESVPFLNPDLWQIWLPVFFVLVVLTLIHEVFKLIVGNWTQALMITNVILCLISITYIVALVTTQEIINPAFLATLSDDVVAELRDSARWARWTVNISAVITIGIYVWDMVNSMIMAKRLNRQEPKNAITAEKML